MPTPDLLRRVYRAVRDSGGTVTPEALDGRSAATHDPRVLVGMLEQAGIVRRGYDAGRTMRVELLPVEADAGSAVDTLLDRYARAASARVERIVGFADASAAVTCRSRSTSARRSTALRCVRRLRAESRRRRDRCPVARPLPADPASTIVDAVAGLTWPLGRRSLVAMLRGSVKAPPSARRSRAFGSLAAASESEVTRWVRALETAGALAEVESDGFRVLEARPGAALPSFRAPASTPADAPLVAELRAWRSRRAREDGVPAYVVLHDATLRELAARRPASPSELAGVKGLGPTKLERYGDELLDVLAQ